jgi:hypothetical protein
VTSNDVVAIAIEGEDRSQSMSLTPATAPMLRRLAELAPRTLAVMHGSSYAGKPAAALGALADHAERKLKSLSS